MKFSKKSAASVRFSRRLWLVAAVAPAALPAMSAAQTWDGGASPTTFWSFANNWNPNVVPVNNGTANLTFAGVVGTTNVVDVPFSVNSIQFNAVGTAWSVSGQPLTLQSGITNLNNANTTLQNNIVLAPSTGTTTISSSTNPLLFTTISGATLSLGSNTLAVFPNTGGSISFDHIITGTGTVSKSGSGTAFYSGSFTNTYTGPTLVNGGLLILGRPTGAAGNNNGSAIQGNLVINGGEVRLGTSEQISDSSPVTVAATGILNVQTFSDFIGNLSLAGGAQVTGSNTLRITSVATNTITYTSGTTPAVISTLFNAGGVNRAIDVTTALGTISFAGSLTASVGLTKLGPGLVSVSTVATNIGGSINVQAGKLAFTTTQNNIILASIVVGTPAGTSPASLDFSSTAAINSGSNGNVTLNPNSSLNFLSASASTLRAANLTLSHNSDINFTNASSTITLTGTLTAASAVLGQAPSLTFASLELGANAHIFDVSFSGTETSNSTQLTLTGRISNAATGGITKTGNGRLTMRPAAGSTIPSLTLASGFVAVRVPPGPSGPLIAPNGTVNLATGTLLDVTDQPLGQGPLNYSLTGATVIYTDASDTAASLSMNSSLFQFLGTSSLTLPTTITSAQTPGGSIPQIIGVANTRPLIIPDGTITTLNVTTATNAASTTTGDLRLSTGINANSDGRLIKTGPGQLYWFTEDLRFGGNLDVNEGSIYLKSASPGTNRLTGELSVGDGLGTPSRFILDNNAISSTLGLTVRPGGTFDARISTSVSSTSLTGGTITSTGGLTFGTGTLTLAPASGISALIDSNVQVFSNTISFTTSLSPVLMNTRFIGFTNTTSTLTGAGTLILTGSPSGSAFPGPLIITNGSDLILDRPTATITSNVTVIGNSSSLSTFRSNQLASNVSVTLDNGFFVLNPSVTETFTGLSITGFGVISGSTARVNLSSLSVSNEATNTASLSAPLFVSGPSTFTASANFFAIGTTLSGPISVSGAATTLAFFNPTTFAGPVTAADSTFFISLVTLDTRSTFANTNTLFSFNGNSSTLLNRGTVTGSYTFSGTGRIDNRGTLIAPAANLNLGSTVTLTNTGLVDLAGRSLSATANLFTNSPGGSLSGPGLIDLPTSFSSAGTILAPAGVTTFLNNFTNAGTTRLTSPSASLAFPTLTNTGRISGDGTLAGTLTVNRGTVEPSPLGQLVVTGRLSNTQSGTVSLPALSSLYLYSASDANAGLISLAGGTLEILGQPAIFLNSSTGRISGYGTLTAAALTNDGSITFSGGTATINTVLTNNSGRTVRVQAGTALFNGFVGNSGTITVGLGGQAVFAGGGAGLPASGSPPAANALGGFGSTILAPGAIAQTDGISQLTLTLQGTSTSPSTLLIPTREPTGQIPATGRSIAQSLSTLYSISVASDGAPLGSRQYFGLISLADNDLLFSSGLISYAADLANLTDLLRDGLASNGTRGIAATTSVNSIPTRLALFPAAIGDPNTTGLYYSTYAPGIPFFTTDFLLRFTYTGDTNIDGTLDGHDLANLIEGLSTGATGWQNGDFNYDGLVNLTDFSLFTTAYNAYLANPLPLGSPGDNGGNSGGSIPEPANLAALLPVAVLTRRRRT